MSPPYRKIRALRLLDTPETPKTIIQKLKTAMLGGSAATAGGGGGVPTAPQVASTSSANESMKSDDDEDDFLFGGRGRSSDHSSFPRPVPVHHVAATANVNPFTPDGMLMNSKKRARIDRVAAQNTANNSSNHKSLTDHRRSTIFDYSSSSSLFSSSTTTGRSDEDALDQCQAPKRLALQDTNISRYEREFVQLSVIGAGEFGEVFRCLNRLDGCIYAVKKSKKPVAGSAIERIALNEVWAHAVLGKHENVVRYYSAWAENNHMLIQNEYCDGGSLQALLQTRTLTEPELRQLVAHIAEGLKYIHSNDLVHLDLKAGNIFLTKAQHRSSTVAADSRDDGFVDVCEDFSGGVITYKIGDLGHVTSLLDPDVEEGDCRYLPAEILHEDYTHLAKADIFALGITLYEAAGGGPLPKNGTEWHNLRMGQVPRLANLSPELNDLIALMTHPDATQRPSAMTISRHPLLCSEEAKSKSQLAMELTLERQKNEVLKKALSEAKKKIKALEMARTPGEWREGVEVREEEESN